MVAVGSIDVRMPTPKMSRQSSPLYRYFIHSAFFPVLLFQSIFQGGLNMELRKKCAEEMAKRAKVIGQTLTNWLLYIFVPTGLVT